MPGCSKNPNAGLSPVNPANNKITGASSNDLLSGGKFSSLNIEIQYMAGFQPDSVSINQLISFLNSIIHKTGLITVTPSEIPARGKPFYSLNDIEALEQNNRVTFNSGNQISVYILIVDGSYSDSLVLGTAYRNTSMCLFGKTIFGNSNGIGQVSRNKLETTVVEHEFGHLLGLTGEGTLMQTDHKDVTHGNHCKVQGCLMYYAAETAELPGYFITRDIPALDPQCLADLRANGGK